jgi:hypothetical protein
MGEKVEISLDALKYLQRETGKGTGLNPVLYEEALRVIAAADSKASETDITALGEDQFQTVMEDAVGNASGQGRTTWLVRAGKRIAAVVPVDVANAHEEALSDLNKALGEDARTAEALRLKSPRTIFGDFFERDAILHISRQDPGDLPHEEIRFRLIGWQMRHAFGGGQVLHLQLVPPS